MSLTDHRPLARFPKDQPMHTTTPDASTNLGSASGSRRHSPARTVTTLVMLAAAAVATLNHTAAPARAADCPNAAIRAQNNSTQLPDCRAYELVTPVFKEGFSPAPTGLTADGGLTYLSNGNFANNGNGSGGIPGGNTYLATRSGSGWASKGLAPGPDYYTNMPLVRPFPVGFSSDARSSLWLMRRSDQTNAVTDLYIRHPDDTFTRIGSGEGTQIFTVASHQGSADLSHIAFTVGADAYEFVGTGGEPRLVSVDNAGQSLSPGECASTTVGTYQGSFRHVISADGRVIFLTCNDAQDSRAVYARVDGTTTIGVSASQCTRVPSDPGGACDADSRAIFQGASADGSRVFFTTSQQLVNGDTDSTNDLYECDIPAGTPAPAGSVNPCPGLHEVSGAAAGADVQRISRISEDGARAYFVARGVLASNTDANAAQAAAGDDNLYVWTRDTGHPDGETRFVARLDSADGAPYNALLAQSTDDGRYLVFGTFAPLIGHGPQADTDSARDIYRYDADTGAVVRLSIDADGQGGNEPGSSANITVREEGPGSPPVHSARTAMSDDAGSVVFTTSEALAPSDANGTVDTYLWHEGHVSLISSGKPSDDLSVQDLAEQSLGKAAVALALISPSGRDVYFETTAQLISTDIDTVFDIYDARVDGGFDRSNSPTCSADACQSPPSAPPPPSQTGSTSSTGQNGSPQTTPAFTVSKLTANQLRRVASTGKVVLSVTTNAPGVLSARATAKITQRSSAVGSVKRAVTKGGMVSLTLPLSKKARAELKSRRKLAVKVLVSQDSVAIARTVSLKLEQPKTAKKKSSRTTSRHAASKGGRS
jgi:hypothetical protein